MGRVGSPASPGKEHGDLHLSRHNKSDVNTLNDFQTEDGMTDEDCSNMKIKNISLLKLKREIRRADLTGVQVFLCCMPRPAVPVDQMHSMQGEKHQ